MEVVLNIILSSTREGRVGERIARWVYAVLSRQQDVSARLVDLRDFPLPFYPYPKSPKLIEGEYSGEVEKKWQEVTSAADGFIIVTPEYNHGYPAVLKNALDYLYVPWNRKPVAFVSYGGSSGGIRAVDQLRQVAIELGMVPIRSEVNIPYVVKALGEGDEPQDKTFSQRAEAMIHELVIWATTLRKVRATRQ